MYTKENEWIEARPMRLIHTIPESRVFILQMKRIIEGLNQAQFAFLTEALAVKMLSQRWSRPGSMLRTDCNGTRGDKH